MLLEEFGDNALVFRLQFWMHLGPGVDGGCVRSELRHRIHARFHQAGIRIASPQRELHLAVSRDNAPERIKPQSTCWRRDMLRTC